MKPIFHPVLEQKKCLAALEEYIGSTELKNYVFTEI